MDKALNNLQRPICYKNPTYQPTNLPTNTFVDITSRSTLTWIVSTCLGQIKQFKHLLYRKPFNNVQTNNFYYAKLLVLGNNTWNHPTVCQQMNSGSLTK